MKKHTLFMPCDTSFRLFGAFSFITRSDYDKLLDLPSGAFNKAKSELVDQVLTFLANESNNNPQAVAMFKELKNAHHLKNASKAS